MKRSNFWPAVFLGAFVAGALLWAIWMYHVVRVTRQQTREQRENSFFVPPANAPANSGSNTSPSRPAETNLPAPSH